MPYKPPLKLVACPFNPQHKFTQERLQAHIIKCERNYPHNYTCPYYSLHRFLSREDLDLHILQCDRKMLVQPWLYNRSDPHAVSRMAPRRLDLPEKGDDWEDWESEYA